MVRPPSEDKVCDLCECELGPSYYAGCPVPVVEPGAPVRITKLDLCVACHTQVFPGGTGPATA